MNCKKTWFGYVNFIVGSLVFGAATIALVYLNLIYKMADYLKDPNTGLKDSGLGIQPWLALLIGVFSTILVFAIYFLIRKFREFLYKKYGTFSTDLAGEVLGGFLSFFVFAAGLFLRVMACLDADITGINENVTIDLNHIENLFMNDQKWSFSSFNSCYDSCISFIYKFTGVKINAYLWFNLFLHVLIMLFIYFAIRNVFSSAVSIFPLAYLALTPECIKNVVTGGYGLFELLLLALGLVIATGLIPLFSESDHYNVINLILTVLSEIIFVVLIPILVRINNFKGFDFSPNWDAKIKALDYPYNVDGVCLVLIVFCFIAAISFFFTNKDRISLVMPVFAICLFFYIFAENSWPSVMLFGILIGTLAGLGFDELLLSRIHMEVVPETVNTAQTLEGIDIPKVSDILEADENIEEENTVNRENTEQQDISDAQEISDTQNDSDKQNDSEVQETTVSTENSDSADDVENNETEVSIETIVSADTDITNNAEITDAESEITDDSEKAEPEEIILFESPIPLPKKKPRKQIGYSIEPSDEKMKFDVDIDDNDDFDV